MGWKKRKGKYRTEPKERKETNERNYAETLLTNELFEEYYQKQQLLSDDEFVQFMETNRTPLPVSFRITGSRENASDLLAYMKKVLIPKLENIEIDGQSIPIPKPIPWYPNEFAWVYECGRNALRNSDNVKEFHQFLVAENEVGNISRQEAVSMIPVLLMDVKPGQYVLDMCAAPGSKTAQLLEGVLGESSDFPDGLVIANDSDQKRAYMLVHQAKRLQTPCVLVTNHDAQEFPRILIDEPNKPSRALQFDRILCDVPCSGDGTIRKNKTVWKIWKGANGNGLHKTQRGILHRGCEMLKVGGRLVYSTCSFNPVENEAVVASVLAQANGALRLVDVSESLPKLKRKPGVTSWMIKDKDGTFHEKFANAPGLLESMFPPENVDELGLEKCMRIYPYFHNCGGFFVAVFEKVDEYGSVDKHNSSKAEKFSRLKNSGERQTKKSRIDENDEDIDEIVVNSDGKGWVGAKESPFIFVSEENEHVSKCCEIYGLSPSFPRDLFLVRTEKEVADYSSIYVVSKKVKEVLTSRNSTSLKVVNTGVKAFVKNGGKNYSICPYRISSEGIQTISPHLSQDRQIMIGLDDLVLLIKHDYPKFDQFTDEGQKTMEKLPHGSCLIKFDPTDEPRVAGSLTHVVVLPFFRANVSASLLLDKAERKSLLNRLTGEVLLETVAMAKKD